MSAPVINPDVSQDPKPECPLFALNNGDYIPSIGLGTWKSAHGEVYGAIRQAVEAGYRHIDCAAAYNNQKYVGKALRELFAPHGSFDRTNFWITSKLWNTDHGKQHVRPALLKTLSELHLEYLDLFLMHWPVSFARDEHGNQLNDDAGYPQLTNIPFIETWREMEKLQEEGLVRNIGVSNFSVRKLEEVLPQCNILPAVNQVEMHPYLPQVELLEYCKSKQIHVTAYSPLCSGGEDNAPNIMEDPVVKRIAKKYNKSPANICLRFAIDRGVSCIPKSVTPERIVENFQDTVNFKLSREDVDELLHLQNHHRFVGSENWGIHLFDD